MPMYLAATGDTMVPPLRITTVAGIPLRIAPKDRVDAM